MWTCSKCGEIIDDQCDSCWKCAGESLRSSPPVRLVDVMKPLAAILWIQLVIGLIGICASCAGVHTGAMGMESSSRLQAHYAQARTSPDLRTPSEVGGMSCEKVLEWLCTTSRARADNAGYCLLLSCGMTAPAVVMLVYAYRKQVNIRP